MPLVAYARWRTEGSSLGQKDLWSSISTAQPAVRSIVSSSLQPTPTSFAYFSGESNRLCLQPIAARLQRKHTYILASMNKTVVVTRERGKNGKLMKALEAHGIYSLELPLIEHKLGTDFERLPLLLNENNFHWIVVTSPEAASVFLQGWKTAGHPRVKIAVVGSGTREVFEQAEQNGNLEVCFTPSKANAKCLAEELPRGPLNSEKVLYPASIKASNEIESGLTARGFNVTRLNTYSTDSVKELDKAAVAAAVSVPVVTFASPTAVKAWVKLMTGDRGWDGAAACIGSTSAAAARQAGLQRVFYPEDPGLDGWITSIIKALDCMTKN